MIVAMRAIPVYSVRMTAILAVLWSTGAALGEDGRRLLPAAVLWVSSELPGGQWPAEALADGVTAGGAGWSSAVHDQAGRREACDLLLDGWYAVTEVTLWSVSEGGEGFPGEFKIQFCTDKGRTWYDIPSARIKGREPKAADRRHVVRFPEVVARGVRVVATKLGAVGDGRYALRLAEVQVAGRAGAGPFYSSLGGEFDADLNNYWRFYGLGLHRYDFKEPMLWGLKWWGTPDTSCCDWAELKLYWLADSGTRGSLRQWLHTHPMDADGYVWATDHARKHLGQHRLFHTSADLINKIWECYRWEGDRKMLLGVPDYGVGIVDTAGAVEEFCSPGEYVHRLGEGVTLAQTFRAPRAFRQVRVKLHVQETSVYGLRVFRSGETEPLAARRFQGTEGHEGSWTTLDLPRACEPGEYRVELRNEAQAGPGEPNIYWTHPVGWYGTLQDVYAGGTSGLNGLLGKSLLDKARMAMGHLLADSGMRGGTEGIVVITHPEHTGVPAKTEERTGPSMPSTYYDLVRSGYKEAFVNNRYLKALASLAELEEAIGDRQRAETCRQQLAKAREAYHRTFWNAATGRYAGWIDRQGRMWDFGEVVVNLEAVLRGAAPPEAARSIMDWIAGRRIVSGDTSVGADVYYWGFAPRKNTLGYETLGELHHWWGGWFYDFRPTGTGRANFGRQEENGGTNPFISYYDVLARLEENGAGDAWARFYADRRSVLKEFHRDIFYRPTEAVTYDPAHRYQAYVMSLPEAGLPTAAVLHGFMGAEPDGRCLRIRPRVPAEVGFLGVRGVQFGRRRYDIEVHGDRTVVIRAGAGQAETLPLVVENLGAGAAYAVSESGADGGWAARATLRSDADGRVSFEWKAVEGRAVRIGPQP